MIMMRAVRSTRITNKYGWRWHLSERVRVRSPPNLRIIIIKYLCTMTKYLCTMFCAAQEKYEAFISGHQQHMLTVNKESHPRDLRTYKVAKGNYN